jgi:hypothetical protein
VDECGSQRHATTITNTTMQNVIAVVQYTNLTKIAPLSNPLQMNLTLAPLPAISEAESEIAALP